ncbi:pentatricopeptide repeat-containing protein At3g29230 [Amborella trichopoda]|uniref:pentatricopeptide repeat-containing protein At3g29230 n=1 Tax=Amborella trichopoda TaxID=13333 RepID=UPI0009BCB4BC|nr:pentatricopeptide repeat-containing protein At3g29230 [Amborella trichopoda]|eukprot:XP_020523111.1 pentatricopeptide repeat-containing protein At3g29230 [Amborella trichopoda]
MSVITKMTFVNPPSLPLSPPRPPSFLSLRRRLEDTLLSLLPSLSETPNVKPLLSQLHAIALRSHLHLHPTIAPLLISSYSLSSPLSALSAFTLLPNPNFIRALSKCPPPVSLLAYIQTLRANFSPDAFALPLALKACPPNLKIAFSLYAHALKFGLLSQTDDIFVQNSFIDLFSKCLDPNSSRKVFDEMPHRDLVTYNSMISAHAKAGDPDAARELFDGMASPDVISYNAVLDGYARAGRADEAFSVFEHMPARTVVSWTTVVSGYIKAGDLVMARMLYDRMPHRNLVSWTIMIVGYTERGLIDEASALLDRMVGVEGLRPDEVAVLSLVSACGESGVLGFGRRVHGHINNAPALRKSTRVSNALVDMYSKCGCIDEAVKVFESIPNKDTISWNVMLQGLANHGHGRQALGLFARMQDAANVLPDGVTFVGVLCACARAGLVDEGLRHFTSMQSKHGVAPKVEHYGCMVDLFGRAGLLNEAFETVKTMPFEPNEVVWGSLLGACRTHNNVGLAEKVVDQLIKLEPANAGNYALLSNVYASVGQWQGVARVRLRMKELGAEKTPGRSSIEVDEVVHEFTVGDRSHPKAKRIYKMLHRLSEHVQMAGLETEELVTV